MSCVTIAGEAVAPWSTSRSTASGATRFGCAAWRARPASTSSWAPAGTAAPTTRPRRGSTAGPSPTWPPQIVREFTDGVGDTGVHPGIIGEIGTDKPWVSALEERVHRAAARASLETGMAITTHGVQSDVGLAQLAIFTEEGVDPSRVIIGHADSFPSLDFYLAALDAGANIQFDFLGHRFGVEETLEPRLVEIIVELLERGYASQILLSQDVCHNRQLKAHGGFGYVYLQQHFLPTLRTAAVGEGEIRAMTIDNPARLLTVP